jgi:hypothetical protein
MHPTTPPIDPREIALTEIQFNDPFVTTKGKGSRKCSMTYKGRPITLQTPKMRLPFVFRAEDTSVSGSICVTGESASAFRAFVQKLDEHIIVKAAENSASWLGKAGMNADVVRQLYKGAYKVNEKYDPTFKMKFLQDDGAACGLFNVWDKDGALVKDMPLEKCFQQGASVTAIVECTGVWIAGGNFGCNWRIRELMVQVPEATRFLFDDRFSDEKPECGAKPAPAPARAKSCAPAAPAADADDEPEPGDSAGDEPLLDDGSE